MRTIISSLCALTLAAVPVAASADEFVVEHADLDLSTKHDQKVLKSRIARAAREFCGDAGTRTGTRVPRPEVSRCLAETTKLARAKMAALVDQASKGG